MDTEFLRMLYIDYNELHDKICRLIQPIFSINEKPQYSQYKEFDDLIKDIAEYKTTLRLLQSMLVHEFHSIDPKFDPLVLCDDHEKWKAVITMLKHKRNR